MNQAMNTSATFESVWAALMETDRQMKESHARFEQKLAESHARFERELEKSSVEFDKKMAKLHDEIKNVNKTVGGMQNSNGSFAEEYFYNSFDNGEQNFFGETFDIIWRNVPGLETGHNAEYDLVLINNTSVAIIEVKYKMHQEDVTETIKKAETFRINYPKFRHYRIYLGMAALITNKKAEQECVKKGIAFIKQVGDTVVINDDHLKVF